MGEEYVKQHITPKAYLKRFAKEANGKYLIGTRRKNINAQKVEFFLQSVENVAWKKNYYDVATRKDIKFWEHYFSQEYETLCGMPLDNIISYFTLSAPNTCVVSATTKDILSRIILSQAIRVPSVMEPWIRFIQQDSNEYIKYLLDGYTQDDVEKAELYEKLVFSDDQTKDTILTQTVSVEKNNRFCQILSNETWIIYYNTYSRFIPFCTSDNPVMIMDRSGKFNSITDVGIASAGTIIYFPISPMYLVAVHSHIYKDALASMGNKIVPIDDLSFIMNINEQVIKQCHQHSFLPEPLFSEAKGEEK